MFIEEQLNEVLSKELERVSALDASDKSRTSAISDVEKLYRLMLDEREINYKERCANHDIEASDVGQHDQEIMFKEDQKHKFIDHVIRVLEFTLPLVCYGIWTKRGFRFEENGVYTSKTFQNIIGKMKPTKR